MSKLLSLIVIVGLSAAIAYAQEAESTDIAAEPRAKTVATAATGKAVDEDPEKVDWSKIDWRKRLTRLQYHITREAGTERPFRNEFWDFFKPGEYRCVGCGLPLFESNAKFDSDCGWPSFDKVVDDKAITTHVDLKMAQPRTEIRCRRCEAHLGHVFNDGPTDTGLRYCLNSAAMNFVSEKQLEKEGEKGKENKDQASVVGEPKKDAAKPAPSAPASE